MSYGRRKIYSDATEITAENVIAEVNVAFLVHFENRNEIVVTYNKRQAIVGQLFTL